MAESSLSLQYDDFRKSVGRFLGYGDTIANWSTDQSTAIESAVQTGYRRFLAPPQVNIDGKSVRSYQWRFLKPWTTLATVASTSDYDAPDDFGGMDGKFIYSASGNVAHVTYTDAGRIYELRQISRTDRPELYSVVPVSHDGSHGQRYRFIFYPTPGAVYTLNYQYNVLVQKLSTQRPYPLGGMQHAETLLESCLAVAEERVNDEAGLHNQRFLERLTTSISQDRQAGPEHLGTMGPGTITLGNGSFNERHCSPNAVTHADGLF